MSVATGCLAVQTVQFRFSGRPAHAAAAPWKGANALDGVLVTFTAVNALRQQIRPDARIHGIITDGGQAVNIIPERAAAEFGVRSTDGAYVRELMGRVEACARAAAQASGTAVAMSHGLFHDSLCHGGFLWLGLGESLRFSAWAEGFREMAPAERIYRKAGA